ncbi:hypothetical protein EPUL_004725 [Erysiphe pulchra]|uniref:tetrahydrofolate synthase n=1 Tax=Erysiphe pulchra TaxID=225359 RepID=A0A2S4PLZ7_9PEZI|nr:hypothetical protein EPUL_004725 [Erysiphe pulchra]
MEFSATFARRPLSNQDLTEIMALLQKCSGRTLVFPVQDAIDLLNTLQSPPEIIKARLENHHNSYRESKEKLITYIDNLNIIHVTGTKGKGSTCAYVDSILNQYRSSHEISLKVGLYTSPHLISVRERIRINSSNISAENFAKFFFQVWDRFDQPLKRNDGTSILLERPSYFRYLTLLSFHVFLQEKVNAAIYEVGIGGEYDSTNIVESPLATGISTIGIDHTSLLGNTIYEIAWHKAGILKKNCPNFYVDQQPEALAVINKRAEEKQVKSSQNVAILPQLESVNIRPHAKFQKQNASLAVYLSHVTLQKLDPNYKYTLPSADPLPDAFKNGLEKLIWRGRCEKKEEETLTWYLDGAHNNSSIGVAINWFINELPSRSHDNVRKKNGGLRILIFNQQGRRDLIMLLNDLFKETRAENLQFNHVIFCPTNHELSKTKGKF